MNASKIKLLKNATIAVLPLVLAIGCASNGAKLSSIETEADQVVFTETDGVQVNDEQISENQSVDSQTHETGTHGPLTLETIEYENSYENELNSDGSTDTMASSDDTEELTEALASETTGDIDESELTIAESEASSDDGLMKVNLGEPQSMLIPEPEKAMFNFAANQYEVSDADVQQLQQHAAYLLSNPGLRLVVEAHSDAQGSSLNNYKLSGKRAQFIVDVLVGHGVPRDLIKVNNYGESFPLTDEKNWDENRRVELKYVEAPKDDDVMASID